MSGKNFVISFDLLASEILFEIFDYLSYNDIVHAFSSLNQRFTAILPHYCSLLKTFITPTRDFPVWQTILSSINSHIEHLIITTTEFSISLDSFPNLKSLVVSSSFSIDYDELALLLQGEQFRRLNSLKIKSEIAKDPYDQEKSFFHEVLRDPNSLCTFESLTEMGFSYITMRYAKLNTNLRSLSLKVSDFSCLLSLLSYTPNLIYLNVILPVYGFGGTTSPSMNFSHIKLKKCSMIMELGGIFSKSFLLLTWFLKQFSCSLEELSLDLHQMKTDNSLFTDSILQQRLLEPMIHLKSLHLYVKLCGEPVNIVSFLSTFQTPFWLDHHWTFAMHRCYLYTLPFHFDTLHDFTNFDRITSTDPCALRSSKAWSHVRSIQFSQSFQSHSSLIDQLKLKMLNLRSIIFDIHFSHRLSQYTAELDQITTVHSPTNWDRSIKDWLPHISPNVTKLLLTHSASSSIDLQDQTIMLSQLDAYLSDERMMTDRHYPLKLECVEIKIILHEIDRLFQHVTQLLTELLEMSNCLQSITFKFYHMPRFCPIPFTDLVNVMEPFNTTKCLEKYRIRHAQNCMQFVKKIA